MKRIYSKQDSRHYTMLKQVLYDLDLIDKDHKWLISDIEAYPSKEAYQELVNRPYLLLNNKELVEILKEEDFQWIWAVFSAIPSQYREEDILRYELPYLQDIHDRYDPYQDPPKLQHPYSEFELYAVDSSYMFLITDNEELLCRFKEKYPLYIEK